MRSKTIAHLSDLHLGRSPATADTARRLCDSCIDYGVDHVVVTGDLTHRGRVADLEMFYEIFAPLERAGRLSVIPGNHDRNTEDCGGDLMKGRLVNVVTRPGLHVVCVDTTGPQNRLVIESHGTLLSTTVQEIERAVDLAPVGSLVVLLLHHHLLPLPVETFGEWIAEQVGWPHAEELRLGHRLITRLRGRCDLILHGHRHVPGHVRMFEDTVRPLSVYNAGSSTELGRARLFVHDDGRLVGSPSWMLAATSEERRSVLQHTAA
jgi:3',5'-cyclic AMP phosphodiesterase CpdA